MKVTLSPEPTITKVEGVPCREWTGTDEHGTPVRAFIRCISPETHDPEALARFDAELNALPQADKQAVMFDLRFVVD
jgi:hypothetical protein